MQKIFIMLSLISLVGVFSSCDEMLDPEPQDLYLEDRFLKDPAWAEGILLRCYVSLPNSYSFEETATDDAVTNVLSQGYRRMATGEWSSLYNPVSTWATAYNNIYYANYFLSIAEKVEWSWESPLRNELFKQKLMGEAYGMRAWYNFQLLQNHGGRDANGNLQGFVILEEPLEKNVDWKLPRNSFEECVQFIYDDIERGFALLPLDFTNTDDIDSTRTLGQVNRNRISGRILKALKSRVALYAASQAFGPTVEKWEAAADASSYLLKAIGGTAGMSASGETFYLSQTDADIIWRRDPQAINTWERQNFPPSLFGNGQTNPSQNFVDAFPMANGYPISDAASGYDENNPYSGRDPRLTHYVIYNGNKIGTRVINTRTEDATDGLNNTVTSTRTGYYLKKLMRENVNLAPNVNSTTQHFYTLMRYTELFLNYAEAANEAWGPTGDPRGNGFTAASIIGAIRARAGIGQPDDYLSTVTSKDQMRELIRNERRLELSFEGFRFWDIRRWDLPLNETAKGVAITNNVHSVMDVEARSYQPHMKYGPIPNPEILKNNNLTQNEGW